MNQAKIRLSATEIELIKNADWILTKNAIIEKIVQFFSSLQQQQERELQLYKNNLPLKFFTSSPKISKGENYEGLPYVVLDYPRFFNDSGFGAIRTMFWWGNFFSITLHMSGENKRAFEEQIINAYTQLRKEKFYSCINKNEWEHYFSAENYIALSEMTEDEYRKRIKETPFIKIATKISLDSWETAEDFLFSRYKNLIAILAG
jgi:hypothetical protein